MRDSITVLTGDCRDILPTLEAGSIHCCVTSPPYYGLRDYGTGQWQGGDPACTHVVGEMRRGLGLATSVKSTLALVADIQAQGTCPHCGAVRVDRQIGQENSPDEYIETLVGVFREVRRLLRDDGTLWLNMGDSYANDTKWGGTIGGKHAKGLHGTAGIGRTRTLTGLPGKNLIGIPWKLAFALQADGWILRQDVCGLAFEHYIRTDRAGARPLPDDVRRAFIASGWITEPTPCECPQRSAGVVLGPFAGSGTTGMVCRELARNAVLIELNPAGEEMIRDRCNITPGFAFSE